MSLNTAEIIGEKIKKLREETKMSQEKLAEKMNMARPGISNWENGKSEPSSSQLISLAKIFKVTTDSIVGINSEIKSAIVIDTCALISRPTLLEEIELHFKELIIPEVVISELNELKDKGKNSIKQKARLAMKNISNKKELIHLAPNIKDVGINDEKIAEVAITRAKKNLNDNIYLLTNDIYFKFLTNNQDNLKVINSNEYMQMFQFIDKKYDSLKSIKFGTLVKRKKIEEIKKIDINDIDINLNNPEDGLTPLIYAVRNKDIPMIEYLVKLPGIDLDKKDKQKYHFGPIHHATQIKNIKIIEILENAGADIDAGSEGKNKGNTPLMISAWSSFLKGLEFFIANNACINQQDNNGFTALTKACIKNDYKAVKLLIDKTDLNIRSKENKKAKEYLNPNKPHSIDIINLFKKRING